MNAHAGKIPESAQQPASGSKTRTRGGEAALQMSDNRTGALAQTQLQSAANNSPRMAQLKAIQEMADKRGKADHVAQLVLSDEDVVAWADEVDETNYSALDEDERKQVAEYRKKRDEWNAALASRVTATSAVSWDFGGKRYHINVSTATLHVTEEVSPKIHYFFEGAGADIKDKQPTQGERGARGTTKVFSALPAGVQAFVRGNYLALLR